MFEKRAEVLHVRILRAHGLRNTQWFGTQDPYCKCWCSSTLDRDKKKTATVTDGGEAAAWDEEFSFFPHKADREFLFFEVKNENSMKNASIGICRLPIKHIVESGDRVLLKTMELLDASGNKAGTLEVALRYGAQGCESASLALPFQTASLRRLDLVASSGSRP